MRGVHVLPWREVAGLIEGPDTTTIERIEDGLELDLVTHDAAKFMRLMLRRNGYVLEQLHSPLVVVTTPEHEELKELGRQCVTRHHGHHYRGFFETQWGLLAKENPPRVKPLLYAYRVLLTGIHLLRSGEIEANLRHLLALYPQVGVEDLIARKLAGAEQGVLQPGELERHEGACARLLDQLAAAGATSTLPELPTARDGLHDLLLRLRA
ncbi:MAG: nucleotidyltransferase domain-containing protein [Planctomycetaceae bacterium]|nr:nucleotidyltransferase domain-containing protein [Planctomycetaceae bacterium]